jgi:hypothetical protein
VVKIISLISEEEVFNGGNIEESEGKQAQEDKKEALIGNWSNQSSRRALSRNILLPITFD